MSFLSHLKINLIGLTIIEFIIFFTNNIIFTLNFTKILLNVSMYSAMPRAMPKNIYSLISPLLNLNSEYKVIRPVKIQNITSSIYVIKSVVLKLLLNILKTSNKIPNIKPVNIKIKKT